MLSYSLQDVLVELLPAAQKLSDHLPAQAFPLQDEAGDSHRRVRHEAPLDQVLDPLLRLPAADNTQLPAFISAGHFISCCFHCLHLTGAVLLFSAPSLK